MSVLLSAASVDVESYWSGFFTKAVNMTFVNAVVSNVGAGSSTPATGDEPSL